jgi:hypothetical protein
LLGSDFSIVVVGQDVKLWIHWPLQKCTGLLLLLLPPLSQLPANESFPLPVCQEEVLQKYLAHWTKHTGFLYSPHFHLWHDKLHQEYRSLSGSGFEANENKGWWNENKIMWTFLFLELLQTSCWVLCRDLRVNANSLQSESSYSWSRTQICFCFLFLFSEA